MPEKSPQRILKEKTVGFPRQAWKYTPTDTEWKRLNSILWRKSSLEGPSSCHILQRVPHSQFSGYTKITSGENWKSAQPSFKTGFTVRQACMGTICFDRTSRLIFKNPSLVFFNQPCHVAAKTELCFQWSLRHWQKHRIIVNTELHENLVHYSGTMCKPGEHYCPLRPTLPYSVLSLP